MRRIAVVCMAALWALQGVGWAQSQSASQASRVTPVVEAYRKASPAVVNISTQQLVRVGTQLFGEDDPFQDIVPDPFGKAVPLTSLGSGFLIHPDGFIVTNAHVVGRAEKITISLADKTTYSATVVAANSEHDLAVLRLVGTKGRKFEYLRLGRSDDLMIGETVIAIGNSMGLQNTCTTGVVSAIDRMLTFNGGLKYEGLIQVDAPINPGNSGGPLLNIQGELIGINTAIRADAQGIGFAIPVDKLDLEFPRLLDFERLNRVVMGLSVQQRHSPGGEEVIVADVAADSPAAGAALEKGDRILALNEVPVAQVSDYLIGMLRLGAGAKVQLLIRRQERQQVVSVTLGERPKADGPALAAKLLGLQLEPVTPDMARNLGLRLDEGMRVTGVEKGGPAGTLGLARGDVLFQLGRWYVTDWDRVAAVLEDVQLGDGLRIGIVRGNVRAYATLRVRQSDTSPAPAPSSQPATSGPRRARGRRI